MDELTDHDPHEKKIDNVTGEFYERWRGWWRKHRPPIFSRRHEPTDRAAKIGNGAGDIPWRISPSRSSRGVGPVVPRTHMESSNGSRVYGTDYGRGGGYG